MITPVTSKAIDRAKESGTGMTEHKYTILSFPFMAKKISSAKQAMVTQKKTAIISIVRESTEA